MLYRYEEICIGCIYAIWHECCYGGSSFCHCDIGAESGVDSVRGKCWYKKEE